MKDVNDKLAELEKYARILDYGYKIPFVNVRIGLDSILGFLPVIGDTVALLLSFSWIYRASRLKIPAKLILIMILRSLIDYLISSVPLIGDIADIFYKANKKNWQSLYKHLKDKN